MEQYSAHMVHTSSSFGEEVFLAFEDLRQNKEILGNRAREEFKSYRLNDDQRRRLAKIAAFPRTEPDISIAPLSRRAEAGSARFMPRSRRILWPLRGNAGGSVLRREKGEADRGHLENPLVTRPRYAKSSVRADSVITETAGCLIRRSAEMT